MLPQETTDTRSVLNKSVVLVALLVSPSGCGIISISSRTEGPRARLHPQPGKPEAPSAEHREAQHGGAIPAEPSDEEHAAAEQLTLTNLGFEAGQPNPLWEDHYESPVGNVDLTPEGRLPAIPQLRMDLSRAGNGQTWVQTAAVAVFLDYCRAFAYNTERPCIDYAAWLDHGPRDWTLEARQAFAREDFRRQILGSYVSEDWLARYVQSDRYRLSIARAAREAEAAHVEARAASLEQKRNDAQRIGERGLLQLLQLIDGATELQPPWDHDKHARGVRILEELQRWETWARGDGRTFYLPTVSDEERANWATALARAKQRSDVLGPDLAAWYARTPEGIQQCQARCQSISTVDCHNTDPSGENIYGEATWQCLQRVNHEKNTCLSRC